MGQIRILIADLHPIFREGFASLLTREKDFSVVAMATDGLEAVALAKKLVPDVAIVDIFIPLLNGIDVARKIKADCPNSKLIMIGAHYYRNYVLESLESGASGYLLKTTPVPEVFSAIRMVMHGQCIFQGDTVAEALRSKSGGNGIFSDNDNLNLREMQILKLIGRGMSDKVIAQELHISPHTVQSHMGKIFRKLDVSSRTEAILTALRRRLLTLRESD